MKAIKKIIIRYCEFCIICARSTIFSIESSDFLKDMNAHFKSKIDNPKK